MNSSDKPKWNKYTNISDHAKWMPTMIDLIEKKDQNRNQRKYRRDSYHGKIFNVDLGIGNLGSEMNKLRPCLVISADHLNQGETVVVLPLSTTIKTEVRDGRVCPKYNNHYILHKENYPRKGKIKGLKETSCVKCEDIKCIDKVRIRELLAVVDTNDLNNIYIRLANTFGFQAKTK